MKLAPRYDGSPAVTLDGGPMVVREPLLRQRRRFTTLVSSLDSAQWSTMSRCDGWRVQDVVAHLTSVDQFWKLAVECGVAGEPSRFLADFDPKATPAEIVERVKARTIEYALSSYRHACEQFCDTMESLKAEDWLATAETPAGHVSIGVLAHHALWDCWIHERDVCVPLGLAQEIQPDEVMAALRYAAALSPRLRASTRPIPRGSDRVRRHASGRPNRGRCERRDRSC